MTLLAIGEGDEASALINQAQNADPRIRFTCSGSGDVGDLSRQREHQVEIRHRQQFGLALGKPLLGGGGLTLRAMPIAAAVVGNHDIGAVLAARDMPAERHRAAALDG